MILTAIKFAMGDELRRIQQESKEMARQEEKRLAIRADLLRRDNESLANAMERVRNHEKTI